MHPLDTFKLLDGEQVCYEHDASQMLHDIEDLPYHCEQAWSDIRQLRLPSDYKDSDTILFVGMGGSAIIGEILQALLLPTTHIPFIVHRGYDLPRWVGPHTLVIASSHSGDTEETITCFEQARARNARLLALGTGGHLGVLAQQWKIPWVHYTFAGQPRAAFGHSFTSLLGIASQLRLLPDPEEALQQACMVVRELRAKLHPVLPTEENYAKQLACAFQHRIPMLYAGPLLKSVAHRWKNQLNENSQSWAEWDELPELNHNTLMSYDHPALWSHAAVVLLQSTQDDTCIAQRLHMTAHILQQKGIRHTKISAWGDDALAHILSMVHFTDYVSYYLAVLYQKDPSMIDTIQHFKQQLALEQKGLSQGWVKNI